MANNIRGITVEIGGNTGPLDRALKDVNKTSRSLQGELREVNRQLRLDPTNTTLLTQRQRLLAESVTNTRNKLETLKEAERQAQTQFAQGRISEEQYRALQREVIRTEQQLRGLESQASRSNSVLNRISETVGRVGDAAGKIGDKMMPATVAMAGVGAAAGKMSIDFEDSVAKVSTIADESEVSIGDLRKGVLKLSDDTGIASTEIANNVYDAISAGQKTGDALSFVTNSTKLAKAGFAEAGQSLDLLTTIMNSYGLKANEVNKVSDILIQTQNKGKTTVAELSSSMGKVIPTANTYGVNLEQVASGYAIMTAKGIKAAETTTYMNSMFNEMGKSGTTANKAIKKASGKTFPELIKSGKSVGDILNIMNDYAKKNGKSLADMFGSAEAGKAALILSSNAGKDFNEMLKGMNNTAGATDEAFKKVSNTTGQKLKKSLNQLKNDAIKLGDSIAPIIQKLSNLAGILAQKLGTLSKSQLDMIVKAGLIVAAIGPIAKIVQGITIVAGGLTTVIGTITGAIGLLTGSLTVATPAATALAGAITFITGPIGLTIIAVTALVAGFTYLWKHCQGFKNFWIGLWNGIKQTTTTAVNVIVRLFTTTIPNAWHSLMNFLKGIPTWFNQLWTSVKINTENIWNGIKDFFLSLWQDIKNIFNTAIEGICNFVMNKFGFVVDGAIGIWNGFSQYIGGVWEIIKNIFLGSLLLILDIVTGNFDKLNTDSMQIWENIKQGFSDIWEGIKSIFSNALNIITAATTNAWNNIKTIASDIWNGILEFFSQLWNNIKTSCFDAWAEMKITVITLSQTIKQNVIDIWNSILDFFRNLPSNLYNLAVNMFTSMKNGIISTKNIIISSAKDIGTSIINTLKDLPKQALEIGKNIIDGLKNGITNGAKKVVDAAKNLADNVSNKIRETLGIHSPSRVMMEIGKFVDEGLALGIEENKSLAVNSAKDLAESVLKEVSKLSNSDIDIKANVSTNEISNNTSNMLNWGDKNKKTYKEYIDFVNKLNADEVKNSKELLDNDYKNRTKNLEGRLSILKSNSKNKNTTEINSLEVSKKALKDYYNTANILLNKRSETVKNSLKTSENLFKNTLNNFDAAVKKLSIDTNNLNSKLEHQNAIVILQGQKINALKNRYSELCSTLGSTNEKTIEIKKSFEDAKNDLVNMTKAITETNEEIKQESIQDIDKLNDFIIKALERKIKAEEKAALETAKIKAKENNLNEEQLERFLNYLKNIYSKKLDQDTLQGQAEQLIMSKNQKSIVQLLNSYGDLYQDAGISLGQRLVLGTKSWSDVLPPIINNTMENVVGTVGQASNAIGNTLNGVMEQIATVGQAGSELAGACGDAGLDFNFNFDFDSVYKNWESSFSDIEEKEEDIAKTIADKYKEAFNRIELAQMELGKETHNADDELKKQQALLEIQKDHLGTLKNKYNEMENALGSSDEVVQLNKDIASLTIEIENQQQKLQADAIRNKYKADLEAIELDTLKLRKSTKNFNEELEIQSDMYMNMMLKLNSMQEAYNNLSKVLGESADEVKQLQKEILFYQQEMENFSKECDNKVIDHINNFNAKIKDSLKERYTQELKLEEDKLNKELENLSKWKDESIKRIDDVYNAKIKSLDDELKAEEKADKDREELNKIHSLEEAMQFEHNEFNKAELQKELNTAIAERNKRLHIENIEDQKANLEQQKQNEINNIDNLYETNKSTLEQQLQNTKKFYEGKLNLANLEAEAEKIIICNNQKEIVELVKSYDKDYENAGKTLGERLSEGMKEKISPIIDMIQNIENKVSALRTGELENALNSVEYSPISSMAAGSNISNSTTNNSNQVINNNHFTFNSPKALSPSEQRRQTETALRNLAFECRG